MSADPLSYGRELLRHIRLGAGTAGEAATLTHVADLPGRTAAHTDWPAWAHPELVAAWREAGVTRPWTHQVAVAEHARAGRHTVVATGTASGKSLGYQLPVLTALAEDPRPTALYLSPTKALGADQLRAVAGLCAQTPALDSVLPGPFDGDTPTEVRDQVRSRSRWVFTNPDMLHLAMLGGHGRWAGFLRRLRFVVIDECHVYRGVFGSNVALVLRRLRRLCRRYGADPVFLLASATTADPAGAAARLIGDEVVAVTQDGSPHGPRTVALWEPPLLEHVTGENGAPVRRSAGAEAARITADLVVEGARTLTFVRSRRGAEVTALRTAEHLAEVDHRLPARVGSYRAGYLAEERRDLERALASGELLAVATTNALELGVDVAGLDAVVVTGYPGSVASFWQQAGRAGRRGEGSLVVLIARDDPLDTYLVHHPEALLGTPVEATVTDPLNPYVLGPHLVCAAAESPITEEEAAEFGAAELLDELAAEGWLRRRPRGWFIAAGRDPHHQVDIRGGIGGQVMIVEPETGRLLGTVDSGRAPATLHPGAVYLHRGESFVVDVLDLDDLVAEVHAETPDWNTSAREITDIRITAVHTEARYAEVTVSEVSVQVSHQVVGYLRRAHSGEVLDHVELEMPAHHLDTRAVLYTVTDELLERIGIAEADRPGALHAAEHAAIGLLPLIASCDRADIGGVSTALHPDTGLPSVFVYDGHPGGAGIAERGHREISHWLAATAEAIAACTCPAGCPSCVQSPKCGNGNDPLDKAGALTLLRAVTAALAGPRRG